MAGFVVDTGVAGQPVVLRSLATGSSAKVLLTNVDGVAGNPGIDLAPLSRNVASDTAGAGIINTTNAQTTLTATNALQVPAGVLAVGDMLLLSAYGKIEQNVTLPTFTEAVFLGATAAWTGATSAPGSNSATFRPWTAEWKMLVTAIGASGSAVVFGGFEVMQATAGTVVSGGNISQLVRGYGAATTIDTTAALNVLIKGTLSVSDVTNQMQLLGAVLTHVPKTY